MYLNIRKNLLLSDGVVQSDFVDVWPILSCDEELIRFLVERNTVETIV